MRKLVPFAVDHPRLTVDDSYIKTLEGRIKHLETPTSGHVQVRCGLLISRLLVDGI